MCGVGEAAGKDWVATRPFGQDLRAFLRCRICSDKVRMAVCKSSMTPIAHISQPRARAKVLFLEATGMEG